MNIETLKSARESRKMSKKELARQVGVSRQTITNIEAGGNTSYQTVVSIVKVLGYKLSLTFID